MKNATEMREAATKRMGDLADTGKKAAYAVVGAPVVAGRRIADWSGRMTKSAQSQFEAWVSEGEKLTEQFRDGSVVEDIKDRVDFDQLQGRVEKLRDQLEDVLANWRDSFRPQEAMKAEAPKPKAAKKPAAKKPATKKPAAKKPAAKPAAKKPATNA
jgi:DNA topoisomerase-1